MAFLNLPAVVQAAPSTVPVLPLLEASGVTLPVPSSNFQYPREFDAGAVVVARGELSDDAVTWGVCGAVAADVVLPDNGAVVETVGEVVPDPDPKSRWAGTLTRKASRRLPPVLLVQIKY